MPDPVFAIDKEGKVILWNIAIENITGNSVSEILNKRNYEHSYCLNGERKPSLIDLATDQALNLDSVTGINELSMKTDNNNCLYAETTCTTKSGHNCCFQVKASPLYDTAGHFVGAIACMKDFTKLKDNEDIIQQSSFHDFLTGLYNRAFIDHEI